MFNVIMAVTAGLLSISECPAQEPLRPDSTGVVDEVFTPEGNRALYGKWRSSKIGGGGYILNVLQNRAKPDTVYTHSDVGGIFRTDDCGRNWYMIHGNTGPQSLDCVRSLLVDPDNPDDLLAAVGNQWSKQQGIYRSTDGGRSWRITLACQVFGNGPRRAAGDIMQRSPRDPKTIFIAPGPEGVFVSHDGGDSWTSLGMKLHYVDDFKVDRANPDRMFLCAVARKMKHRTDWTGGGYRQLKGGFYRSDDSGKSWTKLAEEAPYEMLQSPVEARRWYAIFGGTRIKYSDDCGVSWKDDSEGLSLTDKKPRSSWDTYYTSLGAGPDFLITGSGAGSFYIKKPIDSPWKKTESSKIQGKWYARSAPGKWEHFGRACSSVVVDWQNPAHWFFTDWYSLYQTWDYGKTWTLTIDGIENTVIHTVVQDARDPGIVLMGMADNGCFRSTDGGTSFAQSKCSFDNCKAVAIAPSDSMRVYVLGPQKHGWYSNWLYASADGGKTFTSSPMENTPRGDKSKYLINSICVDSANSRQVYIGISGEVGPGQGGVWKSTDGGKSWTWDSSGLPSGKGFFQDAIWGSGCQLARSADGAMVAVQNNAIYYRHSDDKPWKQAAFNGFGRDRHFTQVVAGPGAFYLAQAYGGLYKSVDTGKSWEKVLDKGVHSVTVDLANPRRIAVALNKAGGLMLSTDGGKSWSELDKHIPQRNRMKLAFAGNRLVVGTPGNGVFFLPLDKDAGKPVQAKASSLPVQQNILSDGACENAPEGWYKWARKGKLHLEKDPLGIHSGAGLKIILEGEKGEGSASHPFRSRQARLSISGYASSTAGEALVAVQCFNKAGKQVAWKHIASLRKGGNVTFFQQRIELPAKTARTNLAVVVKGPGIVRVDELHLNPAEDVFDEN